MVHFVCLKQRFKLVDVLVILDLALQYLLQPCSDWVDVYSLLCSAASNLVALVLHCPVSFQFVTRSDIEARIAHTVAVSAAQASAPVLAQAAAQAAVRVAKEAAEKAAMAERVPAFRGCRPNGGNRRLHPHGWPWLLLLPPLSLYLSRPLLLLLPLVLLL